jgi:hypothetical protein
MPLTNGTKIANSSSTTKSSPLLKKKPANGDSLRQELHGMIPDLSSSDGEDLDLEENGSSADSSSPSTPSSDDEGGVFDARFDREKKNKHPRILRSFVLIDRTYRPIDPSDDMIEFDHGHNQIDVSLSSPPVEINLKYRMYLFFLLLRSRQEIRNDR